LVVLVKKTRANEHRKLTTASFALDLPVIGKDLTLVL
jgi:hypothetical protein